MPTAGISASHRILLPTLMPLLTTIIRTVGIIPSIRIMPHLTTITPMADISLSCSRITALAAAEAAAPAAEAAPQA